MKMSLTRLLKEVKTLESRIQAASSKFFVTVAQGSKPPTGCSSLLEAEQEIKSNYQSVVDLIVQRNKLKTLLVETNAKTILSVAGEQMTIAQALDRKTSIDLERSLLTQMKRQFTDAKTHVDSHNEKVESNIYIMLNNTFGKDRKVSEDEIKAVSDPYRKQHEGKLLDPLKLQDKINKLEEKIILFDSEVDLCLSEINAKTEVEVG